MSKNLNKCFFIGRLGTDPQEYTSNSGKTFVKLNISIQNGEKTDWIPVITFDKLADIAKNYFKKGDKIHIEGSLGIKEQKTKGGDSYKAFSIIANSLINLESKTNVTKETHNGYNVKNIDETQDEIPF